MFLIAGPQAILFVLPVVLEYISPIFIFFMFYTAYLDGWAKKIPIPIFLHQRLAR